MKLLHKIVAFFVTFTLLFALLRATEHFNNHILMDELQELGGVPWLYSVIGVIFSILAAFVIQTEWEHFNRLIEAIREEVGALEQLWLFSFHFPEALREQTHQAVHAYLRGTIDRGLRRNAPDGALPPDEPALATLREAVFALGPTPELMATAFAIFADLVKHHGSRLYYASNRVPPILRRTILFGASLIILFSFFIGVKNVWLDYLFSGGLALLTCLVYLVMDDLDQPLRPGIWQVTTKDYQRLLRKVEAGAVPLMSVDRV